MANLYKSITRIIVLMLLLGTQYSAHAQCEFQELLRADGTLNRNYEFATVFTSDTMNIRMSLAFQGAFRTLRVEFEYTDTVRVRSYKSIYLKMSDSTIVEMYFISTSREPANGRTYCLYEIRQKELGYLAQFDLVEFIYQRKNGSRTALTITENQDILKKQLECVRRK